MTKISKAAVVAWVTAIYQARDAGQRVTEGPAAFLVRIDDGALLVRKRTGEYWDVPSDTKLYRVRSDRRLLRKLDKLAYDVEQPTGMIHDPSQDVTAQQLMAWFDAQPQPMGQITDCGWAFLVAKGQITFGGGTGLAPSTFAVIKRTGEVWDLAAGPEAEAAYYARTEAAFRRRIGYLAPYLQPAGHIPRG